MTKNRNLNSARSLKKWSAKNIAAVFLIEFLLPSALTSYGVFFNDFVGNELFSFHDALWTPIIFLASWNITSPWSRRICEYFEEKTYIFSKYIPTIAILILVLAIISSSFIRTQISQYVSYGILGGTATGLILSHVRTSTRDDFQSKPAIFDALCQISKASSLFIIPHLILLSVEFYGIYEAHILYAAFLLNVIPARLLLNRRGKRTTLKKLSRYKTIAGHLWNQDSIELPTINKNTGSHTKLTKSSSLNSTRKQNDADSDDDSSSDSSESYTIEEIEEDELTKQTLEQDPTPQATPARCKTDMGVEILPEIPEEDEIDEDYSSTKNHSLEVKRLSKISCKFEEILDRNEIQALDRTNSVSSKGTQKKYFFLKDMKRNGSCCAPCCSPYRKYLFRRRTRIFFNTIYDNFIKPLNTSLKTFYFYPALCGKTSIAIVSVIYITIIPHITLESGVTHKVDVTEATFLLTFIAVSWCFFLISLPWLLNTSKTRTKTLHILGLFITSGSMFMLYLSVNHDMITLSCLVFGFGFGIISYAADVVYRDSLGTRKWKKVQGTLETLSGIFVIVIYLIIYLLKLNVITLFLLFFILFGVSSILWLLAPLCNFIWTYYRKKNRSDAFLK